MPHQSLRLEVVNGSLQGQVVALRDHAFIVVGRLPECGLSFPSDLTVSREHFRIDLDWPSCILTHLSRTGQTLVNGNSVAEVELQAGDEIVLGEGNGIRVSFEEQHEPLAAATAVLVRPEPSGSKMSIGFVASKASCGWNLYESPNEQPGFVQLLDLLVRSQQVSTVIDFGRIGLPAPEELKEPHYLFSWMQPPIRDQRSPVVMSISDNPAVTEIIKAAFEKDGVVCFGSKLTGADRADHWRKAIGVKGDQPGEGMTAYFWPSLLNLILTCQSAEDVAPLLSGLTWVFIEAPKTPGKWRLFAKDDLTPFLTKSGLEVVESLAESR